MNNELITLFKQMSDLTAPECASNCRVPHSCCDIMYCEMVEDPPQPTGHPKLLFMGAHGCIVEPHKRPLCTLHTCAINSLGFKPGDPEWTTKYFSLRDKIEELMWRQRCESPSPAPEKG